MASTSASGPTGSRTGSRRSARSSGRPRGRAERRRRKLDGMSDPRLLRGGALVGVGAVAATLAVSSAAGGALAVSGPLQGVLAVLLVLCALALVRRRPSGPDGERAPLPESA